MIRNLTFALLFLAVTGCTATYVKDEYGIAYRRRPHSKLYRIINSSDTTDYQVVDKLKKSELKATRYFTVATRK